MWSNLPESKRSSRPRCQLEWEAQVVEYVSFVWDKVRPRKKGGQPTMLSLDVPLLGPRFIPPSYLHHCKRPGMIDIKPEVQYLRPVNIIHPFYYPELACCPQCQSRTDVHWEGWTATGARELHGVLEEEVALGLQLRCNSCKLKKGEVVTVAQDLVTGSTLPSTPQAASNGGATSSSSYCHTTTSSAYWKSWEHWKIPRKSYNPYLDSCTLI